MSATDSCPQCGQPVRTDAKFCGACGNPIEREPEQSADEAAGGRTEQWWGETPAPEADQSPEQEPWRSPVVEPRDPLPSHPAPDAPKFELESVVVYRRRRNLPFVVVAAVAAVAVIATGFVVASRSKNTVVVGAPTVTVPSSHDALIMPSIVNLTSAQAKSQLSQAGVAGRQINITDTERDDLAPGTVVAQDPEAGAAITGTVTLTVAAPPTRMPNYVGTNLDDARAKLATLGIELSVKDVVDLADDDGTVLRQNPAAGARFARSVTLAVARTPITSNLADLEGTGATPSSSDSETIAGAQYPDSLTWDQSICADATPQDVTYDLGGQYRALVAKAGLTADSTTDPSARVRLDIRVDSTLLLSRTLRLGAVSDVSVSLTGHRQLEITLTTTGGDLTNCSDASVALGRAHLLSLPGDLLTTPTT